MCRIPRWRVLLFLLLAAVPLRLAANDGGKGRPIAENDVKTRLAAAGDAAKWNADAVVVLDATDVTIRPSGIGTARSHKVVKVLRDAAIRGQAVQVFPFDPNTNRLDLVAVRVYRADGSVEEIPLTPQIEQAQPAWGIAWGTRQYLVGVPRLAVGDAVETISDMTGFNVAYLGEATERKVAARQSEPEAQARDVVVSAAVRSPSASERTLLEPIPLAHASGSDSTTEAAVPQKQEQEELNALGQVLKPPVPGHWHDEADFWSSYPIIEKRYTVRAPKNKPLQYEVYGGELRIAVTLEGDQAVYSFTKKDIRPFEGEPNMESVANVAPKLLLATLPTWQDKARWLHSVSEPQLQADDAIRAKVAEIIKDCKTDEEKYTALNHWVAENVRYSGTSRGMCEGYTIHDIKETFRDRCGVCKDKAGMLCGMLRVAGFEAYTVMTMARQRVDRIPADQFNHCVTCIRKQDGSLMLLDPTWMPRSRENWSTLEPLQHVVFGVPEGKELSQSPDFPPQDNPATWKAETAIDTGGRLTGSFDFTAAGAPETRLRRSLAGYPPDIRNHLFEETVQRLGPNARLSSVTCTDPVDFSGPIRTSVAFTADGFALGTGGRRYLALPLLQTPLGDRVLADLFGNTSLKERKYGIKLSATRLAKFEETLKLPAGWQVVKSPDPVDLDGPSAGLHFKIETTPGQVHYTCELVVKRWIIPPEEYANFKSVMEKFDELTGRVITCEVEGAHAQR